VDSDASTFPFLAAKTTPNQGLGLTASSVRSCLAPASSSSGPALGLRVTHEKWTPICSKLICSERCHDGEEETAVRLSSPDILRVVSSAVRNLRLMVMRHPYRSSRTRVACGIDFGVMASQAGV
jgi:hypothetical protein